MKKILIIAILSVLVNCRAFQKEVVIPKDTIQSALDKKFPLDKSMVVARIKLMEPNFYFKDTDIGIGMKYWCNLMEKEVEGSVDLTAHILYEKGAFYLDSLDLVGLTVNEKEFSSEGKLKKILVHLIKNYLECYPVYRLKQTDFKQNVAKLLLRDIKVDGDSLKIIVGL